MSRKEVQRLEVISQLEQGFMKQKDAAEKLNITTRQVRRLQNRYRSAGGAGLVSRKRGNVSGNRLAEAYKEFILKKVREKYIDFGPTLALEKLEENFDVKLSRETLSVNSKT